ncbi:PilW family protein [Thaumasiovibrio sp. DFM-14]|uniref:PilW family protein n=1 Tax=Thaumasiovibrio sp. DFM-14 TaxID=3384792 RepID=UPI0039A0A398
MSNASRQRGMSLIELMVASSVSLLAIGAVGSVYVQGQKVVTERTRQLVLRQNVNDAVRLIAEDLLRAGYSERGKSIKLSGASSVVNLSSGGDTWADFVYQAPDGSWDVIGIAKKSAGGNKPYDWLKMCKTDGTPPLTTDVYATELAGFCPSFTGGDALLDSQLIQVDAFNITEEVVSSSSATSQKLTVQLTASLPATGESYSKEKAVLLRNWR